MHTGFAVATRANEILESSNLKVIPTQMVYRYMDQGLIPFIEQDGVRRISTEDAYLWVIKYTAGRQARAAK